jgi:hypothetical protein
MNGQQFVSILKIVKIMIVIWDVDIYIIRKNNNNNRLKMKRNK